MRYDDPERPESGYADNAKLQINGSPLPVITLIRPIETDKKIGICQTHGLGCGNEEATCDVRWTTEPCVGWLACIHAHHAEARFGYYTAIISDLARFHEDYLADPENALLTYFRYAGPEPKRARPSVLASAASVDELWEVNDAA